MPPSQPKLRMSRPWAVRNKEEIQKRKCFYIFCYLSGKYSKQIKELQTRIEELEEELAIERQNRNKAEKNRATLSRDIEDLGEKLEDAGNNTATQIELNKKRENELHKLKTEMEESNIAFEGVLASTRSKHNNVIAEMGGQIDDLNKSKAKAER